MVGYKSFLRRVHPAVAPRMIDPLTLPGLELYLRSDQTDGVNNGDPVVNWFDLSGHGRTFVRGAVGANTPTLLTNATPNGKQLVRFDGASDPNGDYMQCNIGPVGTWPSNSEGWTFYFIGKFYPVVNATGGAVIFADQTTGRPQLICDEVGAGRRVGWRELPSGVTQLGGLSDISGTLNHLEWIFPAVASVRSNGEVWVGGNLQLSAAWNFASGSAGPLATLGMGPLVVSTKMDLAVCLWYSRSHSLDTRNGVLNFFRNYLGSF